jgi:hypothetical protein
MVLPFKFFAGGHPGSGRQWFSWVHRQDVVGAFLFAIQNPNLKGPVNIVSPQPVTMKQFCQALGKAMHRPSWAPVPAFVLRAAFGEMSEMLLTGQRVLPQKLKESGYSFQYPALEQALDAILQK